MPTTRSSSSTSKKTRSVSFSLEDNEQRQHGPDELDNIRELKDDVLEELKASHPELELPAAAPGQAGTGQDSKHQGTITMPGRSQDVLNLIKMDSHLSSPSNRDAGLRRSILAEIRERMSNPNERMMPDASSDRLGSEGLIESLSRRRRDVGDEYDDENEDLLDEEDFDLEEDESPEQSPEGSGVAFRAPFSETTLMLMHSG